MQKYVNFLTRSLVPRTNFYQKLNPITIKPFEFIKVVDTRVCSTIPICLVNQINKVVNLSTRDYSVKKSKDKGHKVQKPKVELNQNEIDGVINSSELIKGFKEALEHLKQDFNDNLNLRLTPSSFEQLKVKTSSGQVKLGEIVQVEAKSANMFIIDLINSPEYVKQVYDAIVKSNLNVNPQVDKTTINIPISKVTREHRENMAKSARLKCENSLKKMRDLESKALRKAKDAKHVSKDLMFNVNQWVKYQFEIYSNEAKVIRDDKIKEILQE